MPDFPPRALLRRCGDLSNQNCLKLWTCLFHRKLPPRDTTNLGLQERLSVSADKSSELTRKPNGQVVNKIGKRYKKLKKRCQEECRSAYNIYITEMIAPDMDSHPKKFWSFIKSKHTDKCGNAPLKDEDGLTANQQLKLKSLTNGSALFLPVTIFRTTFRIKVQAHTIPWEGSQSL